MKKVLSVLSKNDVVPLPTLFAFTLEAHVEGLVPLVWFVPACKNICKYKLAPLSSLKAPVVSAG